MQKPKGRAVSRDPIAMLAWLSLLASIALSAWIISSEAADLLHSSAF
jgi:hypothetical protein